MDNHRLERLRFMAEHNGVSPERYAQLRREGKDPGEHGAMIPLTPTELKELLP